MARLVWPFRNTDVTASSTCREIHVTAARSLGLAPARLRFRHQLVIFRRQCMRKAKSLVSVIAVLSLLMLVGAPAAADPAGFNGTVKVHEGATEPDPIRQEHSHVCTFHLHGFNFDASATGWWKIEGWSPHPGRSGAPAAAGNWGPADANGNWRTGVMTLPDGHYKLFWDQTAPPAPGAE